jgi:Tfp pilus assembly protein PilO
MAESGLRSPKAQLAVAVLAVVALAVLYWQFLYSSLSEDEQRQTAAHRKLEKENKDLSQEERIQNDMLKCKPELDALNRENELMLPALAEPVAFLKNLSGMAATAGLEQGTTRMLAEAEVAAPTQSADDKRAAEAAKGEPGDAAPCWEKVPDLTAAAADKATFVRVPFVIEVRGTFHQLMRYFWMLHEHGKAGRIITVEDLSLSSPQSGVNGIVMTAKFTAVGFREPDSAAAAAIPDTGEAARGGRGQVKAATARREAQVEAASASEGSAPSTPASAAPAAPATPDAPADKAKAGADRITNPGAP